MSSPQSWRPLYGLLGDREHPSAPKVAEEAGKKLTAHNECLEYQRLQHAYDDAILVGEQDRLPSIRPMNAQKLSKEEAAELRDQALLKRNVAANDLYTHLKNCPTCKHFKK